MNEYLKEMMDKNGTETELKDLLYNYNTDCNFIPLSPLEHQLKVHLTCRVPALNTLHQPQEPQGALWGLVNSTVLWGLNNSTESLKGKMTSQLNNKMPFCQKETLLSLMGILCSTSHSLHHLSKSLSLKWNVMRKNCIFLNNTQEVQLKPSLGVVDIWIY